MKKFLLISVIILSACADTIITYHVIPDLNKINEKSFTWENVDLDQDGIPEDYVSSIKSQVGPSCVLYAATGALEIQLRIDNQFPFEFNLSEFNIFNCVKKDIFGVNERLDWFMQYGILDENTTKSYEYREVCDNCMSEINNQPIEQIPFYGIDSYETIILSDKYYELEKKKEIIKKNLKNGPVIITIGNWASLQNLGNRLVCVKKPEDIWSGHEVIIVGYKEDGNILIVKNSHGGNQTVELVFSDDCRIAMDATVIHGTWIKPGEGTKYCFNGKDIDKDGVDDAYDNCPLVPNTNQSNQDKDLLGDSCDKYPSCTTESGNPWLPCATDNN